MYKTIEYAEGIREAFALEAEGLKVEGCRKRAEWAGMMAAEIKKQGMGRMKDIAEADTYLHEAHPPPDLAAVEASLDRSRLLLQSGTDVAAMALDAVSSIQASNSLEKMLAHQMATAHKLAMQLMGQVCYEQDAAVQTKRLNAAARCMAVYQQGLQKVRQNGQQRITVQYVNVSHGSRAVIGSIARDTGADVQSKPAIQPR